MKKLLLALFVCLGSMTAFSSCVVTSCSDVNATKRMPLVKYNVPVSSDFVAVFNNTMVDVVFTQGNSRSVELACPKDYEKYLDIKVVDGTLRINKNGTFAQEVLYNASKHLSYSKLYVSCKNLQRVHLNGSSEFTVSGDVRTGNLDVQLNGSGDIRFNGVQSQSAVTVKLNGSGDISFSRELKTPDADIRLNGSGDIDCAVVTAEKVSCALNGSGDIDIKEVATVDLKTSLNGSGDLKLAKILADNVASSLNGSGDIELKGKCNVANYRVSTSGDISASGLESQEVSAEVAGSGWVSCYPLYSLTAKVTGSGKVKYKGDPVLNIIGKKRGAVSRISD